MLIRELVTFAERMKGEDDFPKPYYGRRTVSYIISLNNKGGLLIPRLVAAKEMEQDNHLLAPDIIRTQAPKAILLTDTAQYIFGVSNEKKKPLAIDKTTQHYQLYCDLLRMCYEATQELAVQAVMNFVMQEHAWEICKTVEGVHRGDVIAFRVNSRFPTDAPSVIQFWADYQNQGNFRADNGYCAVCGQERQLFRKLPLRVKGIPGGMAGGDFLVSANESAYWSWGETKEDSVSLCEQCGLLGTQGLNYLLENTTYHVKMKGVEVGIVFWEKEGDTEIAEWIQALVDPTEWEKEGDTEIAEWIQDLVDPTEVEKLIKSVFSYRKPKTQVNADDFYAIILEGARSRVQVVSELHSTVRQLQDNVLRWFAMQQLTDSDGAPQYFSLYALAKASERLDEKRNVPKGHMQGYQRKLRQLLVSAVLGTKVPAYLLSQTINRIEKEIQTQGIRREQIALLKLILIQHRVLGEDMENESKPIAYQLGELFALCERIQYRDTERTTIRKKLPMFKRNPRRYWDAVWTIANRHLDHLKKVDASKSTGNALHAQFQDMVKAIGIFPERLSREQVGVFLIGYDTAMQEHFRAAKTYQKQTKHETPSEQ